MTDVTGPSTSCEYFIPSFVTDVLSGKSYNVGVLLRETAKETLEMRNASLASSLFMIFAVGNTWTKTSMHRLSKVQFRKLKRWSTGSIRAANTAN